MKKTSLEEFNSIVDSSHLSIKKYIVSSDEERIVLEDYEDFAWGKNTDLSALFEWPCKFPIKKFEVVYKEKICCYIITLHLK